MNDVLHPAWLGVSALVFGRIDSLRPSGAAKPAAVKLGDLMPRLLSATEPRDMSREELESWIEDDTEGVLPAFTDPSGSDDPIPGPRMVGLRTRLALLRLCAGFGDITRLTQIARPGTITLIEGVPIGCFDVVNQLLHDEVLSLARRLSGGTGAKKSDEVPKTFLLTPRILDGAVSQNEMARLDANFAEGLEGTAPLVILLPTGVMPSQSILAAAPLRIALAPLTQSILLQLWAATHPTRVKTSARAIVARLPPDDLLASVTDIVLLSALRKGDPRRAADALTARCAQASAPNLADLPDSPAVAAARALVADVAAWQRGEVLWGDIPHSLLLHGPAGTGKSHVAKAMASAPGLRFISASFAEWQRSGHLGDMLRAMHASFAEAMAAAPAILFIDEVDSASSRSDGDRHALAYRRQVINGLLLAIDQLNAAGGVILVGACNDVQALDPAILRPGRFDRKIEVLLPHRAAIACVLAQGLGTALTTAEITGLSRRLIGQSMATVDTLIRNAKSAARVAGRPVGLADLDAHLPGPAPNAAVTRRVAIHEAGHTIVAHLLQQGRVTRVSLGNGGGLTERTLNESESTEATFNDHLAVHLAGRAAERLVLGTISAGAGGPKDSDLAMATRLATMIDTQFGLGAYGPVYVQEAGFRDPALVERIRTRLEAAEARATQMLAAHQAGLMVLADALVAEGELSGARLDGLLASLDTPACSTSTRSTSTCASDTQDYPVAC
ncbi:MAG: AAA family ATPase [Pseudotabrizicola sp.]|uniref:AAA family ATPase n=1 Tax=Pseudotabrizicola sp. TaxID=2939647 RepID=UPI002730D816|nr:AAA family ATPase [Pseudotabrizicola sp.]MDZ7576360.1 AAA family ATPase [Pseudotabrizicola sp.]